MKFKMTSLALLVSLSVTAAETSIEEYIGKIANIYIGKSETVQVGIVAEEDKYLECQEGNWPLSFQLGQVYSDSWLDLVSTVNRTQETVRIGYTPDSESSCDIEYLALVQGDGISGVDPDDGSASLLRTGDYGNIALIGTNGLTESSYSVSDFYNNDVGAAAFDGFTYKEQINDEEGVEKLGRGFWMVKKELNTDHDPDFVEPEYWLQVDFDGLVKITGFRVVLNDQSRQLGRGPEKVVLQVSSDGETFVDHESYLLSQVSDQIATLNTAVTARIVRLKVVTNHGDTYIEVDEFELFSDL
ncbi:discoidin domain-containing protein [Thalassomonas actiniarum]|uniref:Discoidin domain-containing protein n=1 Tax=Thalassomonas actiniarum TaxID=485447 RepID=A0AAE9YNX6_9GAMM|nr:discoidin domain-containing protein [Thalassomonas actiniarum]WDD98569.1 discoidin domain-containing protein [Thalassomonas actiniarum]